MRAGLELWAERSGARLILADDSSRPEEAVRLYGLLREGCRLVLGPYGSDSTRAVAQAGFPGLLWNHGAAADDVQLLPGAVSVPSPASRYLVALGLTVAVLRPGASVVAVTGKGRFARLAREGLERAVAGLGLELAASFTLADSPVAIADAKPDAVLLCGPAQHEVPLLRALAQLLPDALLGGVSPALAAFPDLLGQDPEGFLAPAQWHASLGTSPQLGPSSAEVIADARSRGLGPLDYVAAQAYACALVAERCLELSPDDPEAAARALRTNTFFGAFELDETGLQRGHRMCVVRWRRGRQQLLFAGL